MVPARRVLSLPARSTPERFPTRWKEIIPRYYYYYYYYYHYYYYYYHNNIYYYYYYYVFV